jgi:hypothetical protein
MQELLLFSYSRFNLVKCEPAAYPTDAPFTLKGINSKVIAFKKIKDRG